MGYGINKESEKKRMENKILIGTNNQHKVQEIRQMLPEYEIVTPDDLHIVADFEENGKSFEDNAIIKALAFSEKSGIVTIADDSGLEVDSLNGEPGIYSARYCRKENATDADRRNLLLHNLRGKQRPWKAQFRCVIAMSFPDGELYLVHGKCVGEIIPEERGTGGFGYDPIFYIPSLGKTLSEMTSNEKNNISHRGAAIREAKKILSIKMF